jgi:hypothetical protein
MSPLESLASSAVRTANISKASLILVLTRGGTTARLVGRRQVQAIHADTERRGARTEDRQ